ncbi:hypothetical protein L2E82_26466 [Cichorium intybus]|uniref:Uncharacterized protein n=1 Tax=Cichorium intybus TaxID=13427 RepID=A0ACB9CQY7_CICIN|nr:hypothetical protein L2E82_26466 [Cichorium intybus]
MSAASMVENVKQIDLKSGVVRHRSLEGARFGDWDKALGRHADPSSPRSPSPMWIIRHVGVWKEGIGGLDV